jgi:hypothetical protein
MVPRLRRVIARNDKARLKMRLAAEWAFALSRFGRKYT